MIREIEKPEIEFKFNIYDKLKFYYDEENEEYFLKTEYRSKYYFNLEGNVHRIGKPAIEYYDRTKQWMENGNKHRLDGPAYVYNSYKYYWKNNNYYTESSFAEETKHLVCEKCGGFCRQGCFI